MSEHRSDLFDSRLSAFRTWQESPWGRLRYVTAAANLGAHLGPEPLRVLDVGGGNGLDAIELAMRGHHVTIADIAVESPAEARARAEERGVGALIDTRVADLASLGSEFAPAGFDVALCHNVIQYLSATAEIDPLIALVRHGGLVSVIAPNADADPLITAVRSHDLTEALHRLDSPTRYTQAYGTEYRACYPEDVRDELAAAGLKVLAHYGIRTVCDYLVDDERKSDPAFYAELERLELALSTRAPYVSTARFFHFVAVRQVG